MGMDAKGHALYGGFLNQGNERNLLRCLKLSRTVMRVITDYCFTTRQEKALPSAEENEEKYAIL